MSTYQYSQRQNASKTQSLKDGAPSVATIRCQQHDGDNICNRSLLTLVARGNAIITELHRLIELVPEPFRRPIHRLDSDEKFTLGDIICDFSYFRDAESFEAKIESNGTLKKADENFCDNFIDILTRFYLTFESTQRYAADLNNFMLELEEDAFVGQSLDGLLLETESRQLLCEAYFLLGYMLLTVDNNFEGGLRERLIVSYYRYSSYKSSPDSSLDDTCNLMRSTGFKSTQQQTYRSSPATVTSSHRPDGYPESFFSRVGVNQSIVNLLIAKLQSVDIYNQTLTAFPHPDHRSVALSQQAAILYVILYFCPNILSSQRSRMREITDKFFYDNWIISIYMGEIVNLIEAWEPYKAAKESLTQLLDLDSIKSLVNQYNLRFYRASKQLGDYLREGWLNENSVLEHHSKILNQIRESNSVVKWMLLHSQTQQTWQLRLTKSSHSIVTRDQPTRKLLYKFLQDLSELEKKFSTIYNRLLSEKEVRILEERGKAVDTLDDLISIFNDTKPMRWIQAGANSKLSALIERLAINLKDADMSQTNSRDLIINVINELESARDSYTDGKNLQVVQLFMATRDSLLQILRSLSLTDDIKILLHSISDFSYAWRIMDTTFTSHMQQMIKEDPVKVYGIESTFLKLASAFDTYLIRIQQVNSPTDLISVSRYYSSKLVSYIRDVLHIVPATILELVSSIISIQTEHLMGEMPSKVPLDSLKSYALAEKRYEILELTHKVSHYAESMLMMQDTTIGLIRINSKQLLEDGIRRELVKRLSDSMYEILQFEEHTSSNIVQTTQNLLAKLDRLNVIMNGFKRSFEYIQDYLFIYGLRMFQEELNRIIKFNVDQAIGALLDKHGYQAHNFAEQLSQNSTSKAPIPVYSSDPLRSSIIVRILYEVLKITDPRSTIYEEQMSAWYEQKPQREKVADLKVFELISSSLCVAGLNGLDQICCSLIMLELQRLDDFLVSIVSSSSYQAKALAEVLSTLIAFGDESNRSSSSSTTSSISSSDPGDVSEQSSARQQQANKLFSSALAKIAPFSDGIINHLLSVGQLQAIRSCISCVLSTKCRHEARNLYHCLESINTSLLATLKHGRQGKGKEKQFSQQKIGEKLNRFELQSSPNFNAGHASGSSINHQLGTGMASDSDSAQVSERRQELDLDLDEEESGGNLEDSQLIFELTNHLEWIGLSDPLSKVYTLSLQSSKSSQVYEFRQQLMAVDIMLLVLLEQCSKFHFSPLISGFVPKQSRSFLESNQTVDGQPLFYGLTTLLNHYQPFLQLDHSNQQQQRPLNRLLQRLGLYVKCSLDHIPAGNQLKHQELTLELANVILSMIELIRLSRQSPNELISATHLPQFLLETFQFTICHLNSNSNNNK